MDLLGAGESAMTCQYCCSSKKLVRERRLKNKTVICAHSFCFFVRHELPLGLFRQTINFFLFALIFKIVFLSLDFHFQFNLLYIAIGCLIICIGSAVYGTYWWEMAKKNKAR